ncbi:transcriptional regulator family protein [Burkholderia pseudomallei Pakistan 9]|nr:transcriptional regulator family protein [Burkholderia pseudomallei Pakistan 9]
MAGGEIGARIVCRSPYVPHACACGAHSAARPMADVRIVRTCFFRRKNVQLTQVLSIL